MAWSEGKNVLKVVSLEEVIPALPKPLRDPVDDHHDSNQSPGEDGEEMEEEVTEGIGKMKQTGHHSGESSSHLFQRGLHSAVAIHQIGPCRPRLRCPGEDLGLGEKEGRKEVGVVRSYLNLCNDLTYERYHVVYLQLYHACH